MEEGQAPEETVRGKGGFGSIGANEENDTEEQNN